MCIYKYTHIFPLFRNHSYFGLEAEVANFIMIVLFPAKRSFAKRHDFQNLNFPSSNINFFFLCFFPNKVKLKLCNPSGLAVA